METQVLKLTKGRVALVDAADYAELSKWKWSFHCGGYAVRGERRDGRSRAILMHRQILAAPAGVQVDHRNGDKLDNRRSNIRLASNAENGWNTNRRQHNRSGFKGVTWVPGRRRKHWCAEIRTNGRRIHLGYFSDLHEAAAVYDAAALRLHGDFAATNEAPR